MTSPAVALININGLTRERMEAISHSLAYDILCVTETQLHCTCNSDTSILSLSGYQEFIRLDRTDGAWGGVELFVITRLSFTTCPNYIIPD